MAQNIFKGLGIALITPFNTDGSVDYQSLKRLVEFQSRTPTGVASMASSVSVLIIISLLRRDFISILRQSLKLVLCLSYYIMYQVEQVLT